MSANAAFKARHSEYFSIGLLCAIAIHAVAFAFWPEYVPTVYRLKKDVIPRLIPPPVEFEIPPPPREIEPPRRPVEIMPEDGADPEQTIEPTFFNQYVDMPLVAPPPPVSVDFLAFEKAPELLEAAVPEYPDIARKAGVEGLVVVWVLIDETGRVISAEIAASDAPVLNQASLDAAYRHRFLPAYQRDVAVKSRISLRFRFVLSD
jgi:protein TonB